MIKLKGITKKENLRKDLLKPTEGVLNPAEEKSVPSDIPGVTPSLIDETIVPDSSEEDKANHLFIVAGQECISVTKTIPQKVNRTNDLPKKPPSKV
jgi:hypothetical protein